MRRAAPAGSPNVVQGVEQAYQVVALAREVLRRRDVEPGPLAHAGLRRGHAGGLDRRLVDVEARERRVLERLRHDDRGRTESAPHVGNARSRPQLLDYAIQGR